MMAQGFLGRLAGLQLHSYPFLEVAQYDNKPEVIHGPSAKPAYGAVLSAR